MIVFYNFDLFFYIQYNDSKMRFNQWVYKEHTWADGIVADCVVDIESGASPAVLVHGVQQIISLPFPRLMHTLYCWLAKWVAT